MGSVTENIKNIRRQKGISQESIAYDLGIDYSTYGKIERGQIGLTVDRLEKIATILDVSIEEIYRGRIFTEREMLENVANIGLFQEEGGATKKFALQVESLRREVQLLKEQLKDKEKIIKLLENKITKRTKK